MSGFVDIHEHVIYGMDDGPRDYETMGAMLKAAYECGITTIIATPHATPGVELFDNATYQNHIEEARQYCAQANLPITLYTGAEIFYTRHTVRFLNEGKIPTLAGTRYVLIEFVPIVRYEMIVEAVSALLDDGYIPILAHIERYRCLMREPKKAFLLKRSYEVHFQVNCGTILSKNDFFTRRCLKKLFAEKHISFIATDGHNATSRTPHMREAFESLVIIYGRDYAENLTGKDGMMFVQAASENLNMNV